MPVISRFLGIVIAMYRDDHVPARFHAKYGILRVGLTCLRRTRHSTPTIQPWHGQATGEPGPRMTEGRRKQKPDHETGVTPGAGLDVWLPSIMDPAAT